MAGVAPAVLYSAPIMRPRFRTPWRDPDDAGPTAAAQPADEILDGTGSRLERVVRVILTES